MKCDMCTSSFFLPFPSPLPKNVTALIPDSYDSMFQLMVSFLMVKSASQVLLGLHMLQYIVIIVLGDLKSMDSLLLSIILMFRD